MSLPSVDKTKDSFFLVGGFLSIFFGEDEGGIGFFNREVSSFFEGFSSLLYADSFLGAGSFFFFPNPKTSNNPI